MGEASEDEHVLDRMDVTILHLYGDGPNYSRTACCMCGMDSADTPIMHHFFHLAVTLEREILLSEKVESCSPGTLAAILVTES